MAPFGNYLAEQSRFGKVYANRTLAGSAVELMRKTMKRFFPEAS